jgi:hypothetical protein
MFVLTIFLVYLHLTLRGSQVHMTFEGPAVLDISQHFVERWNEIKKRKVFGAHTLFFLDFIYSLLLLSVS